MLFKLSLDIMIMIMIMVNDKVFIVLINVPGLHKFKRHQIQTAVHTFPNYTSESPKINYIFIPLCRHHNSQLADLAYI